MGILQEIIPFCGFILQAGTCNILSLAEFPRWSQVWQYNLKKWKINRTVPDGWRKTGKLIIGLTKGWVDRTHHSNEIEVDDTPLKSENPFLMTGEKSGKLMDNFLKAG